jgi:hypothetical protein
MPPSGGVSFEDRQDLLGHCSRRFTSHYSARQAPKAVSPPDSDHGDFIHAGFSAALEDSLIRSETRM